jgi:hypothetical protein
MSKDPLVELSTFGDEYLVAYGIKPMLAPKPPQSIDTVDVASLTNIQLTTLYSQHAGYAAYVATKVAQVEAAIAEAASALELHVAQQRVLLKEEGDLAENQILPTIKSSVEYLEIKNKLTQRKTIKTMLSAYYRSYRTQYMTLSRVVSIRQVDVDATRGGNLHDPGRIERAHTANPTPRGRTGFGLPPPPKTQAPLPKPGEDDGRVTFINDLDDE